MRIKKNSGYANARNAMYHNATLRLLVLSIENHPYKHCISIPNTFAVFYRPDDATGLAVLRARLFALSQVRAILDSIGR